ncbi:MAG TPA: nitroreductase family protein [Dehalococcoidia bacterium]|nr:nitroreductase family protein [Dehalococcoidia bacterium]
MDFFEVLHTQRSIRKFKPDPVPDEALWKMIDTAIRAPSGGNTQPWAFLIIRDEARRHRLADAVRGISGDLETGLADAEKLPTESARRMRRASVAFRHDVASAPVIIIPCLVNPSSPSKDIDSIWAGSSIYGAVQNMMLAARAQGLGTVLTTFNVPLEDFIRKEFGVPEGSRPVAVIPVGYPDGQNFGPTTRKPVESVTYWDGWGQTKQR